MTNKKQHPIIYVINLSEQCSSGFSIEEFTKRFNENLLIEHPHDHTWLYITQNYNEMKQILDNEKLIIKLLEERGKNVKRNI